MGMDLDGFLEYKIGKRWEGFIDLSNLSTRNYEIYDAFFGTDLTALWGNGKFLKNPASTPIKEFPENISWELGYKLEDIIGDEYDDSDMETIEKYNYAFRDELLVCATLEQIESVINETSSEYGRWREQKLEDDKWKDSGWQCAWSSEFDKAKIRTETEIVIDATRRWYRRKETILENMCREWSIIIDTMKMLKDKHNAKVRIIGWIE